MSIHKLVPGFNGLSCALMHKDDETHQHSSRVARLGRALGKFCGLDTDDLSALEIAACLHDIGKIGIPDAVLCKPAKFDTDDWKLMYTHPERGEDIILALGLEQCSTIAVAVRHHHEYFDGTGYPDRLKGEDIPYLARIVSIVDSYDAMTFRRFHQKARTHAETMNVLYGEEGRKSDPYLFRKFTHFIEHSILKAQ